MANLYLTRKDNVIQLWGFSVITDNKLDHVFELPCSEPWVAELLKRNLDARLQRAVAAAREEAYKEGWHDAKAKRKNKTTLGGGWFAGWLNVKVLP